VKEKSVAASTRSEKLDLRLSPEAKLRIVAAAEAAQRSVSDFVLYAALKEANETLPDRRYFSLNAEQWEAFMEALDAPVTEHPNLAKLLREPSVFDIGEIE
jgi:uncharacterized protein (DUF1778 family)